MKNNKCIQLIVCSLVVCAINFSPVFAGGPLLIFDASTGTPFAYGPIVGFPVPVLRDLGPTVGPLTNAEADFLTTFGFAEWSGVPSSSFSAAVVGDFTARGLPDIIGFGAAAVVGAINGPGIDVMYDHDGSIISGFFGAPPGVMGIASPDFAFGGTPELAESWAVLNGTAIDPADVPATVPFPGATFAGVFTHEFGHSINLAHTQTNGAIIFFGDDTGPTGCPPGGLPYAGGPTFADQETMYPFIDPTAGSIGLDQSTVDLLDDISSVSNVYPAAGWPGSFGTITGTIFLLDGVTEVTGVNVIARNVAAPFSNANSALSGDFTQGLLGPDGLYTFNGLTPGASYVVYVDEIVAGGFSTPPTVPLPGPEEFWNAGLESADIGTDLPCDAVSIFPAAGSPFTADIIFNGDPTLVDLGDDDFEERPLPFDFPACGTDYSSVFIGSNGFLTFGAGDTDFSESVSDLLGGPPRIAPMWDDLNPSAGGTITADEVAGDYVVTYTGVPEFPSAGSNTFTVTLRSDGSFNFDYGAISASDGLVGRAPAPAGDPGEIDVTAAPQPITGAPGDAVYEIFTSADNDLSGVGVIEWDACPELPPLPQAAFGVCYASTGAADGGRLLTIDPTTGAGTLVGLTGLGGVPGLAINSSGQMFGTERITGNLYRINPSTGAAGFVGSTGVTFLDAIAFDENDVLYGIGFDPPFYNLRTINTQTGASTIVGPTGDVYTGMAFDPTTGIMYASVGGFLPITPDGIATIDKTTGAATVIGTTGLGGPTPDLHFDAAGNLYGTKGGGGSPNDLISIDKSTAAGTVIGPIGFFSVSGLASRQIHPFVFLAEDQVLIDEQSPSAEGDVHSNNDILVGRAPGGTTHTGNLTAVDNIEIRDNNTIVGDVTAGGSAMVDPSSTVTGTVSEFVSVASIPLPTLSFTAGGSSLFIPPDDAATLAPGSYDIVDVGRRSTLTLSAGDYFMNELVPHTDAVIYVDVTSGPVTVNVVDLLQFRRRSEVMIGPSGESSTRLVTFNYLGTEQVSLVAGSRVLGTIIAPNAKVRMRPNVVYKGAVCADNIRIDDDVVYLPHSSTTPLPSALTLLAGSGENLEASLPTVYELSQNYPNPFNPSTVIEYALPEDSRVRLEVYNVLGERVATLVHETQSAGYYEARFDATGLASGLYIYRMQAGNFVETRKLMLLK
jgi:hypothetical protein